MTVDVRGGRLNAITADELHLLGGVLRSLADNQGCRVEVVSTTDLRRGVHRLVLDGAAQRSVVVKRIRSKKAQLERLITGRWLPGAGLDGFGPPRLAAVAESDGRHVWHVYDDLGPWGLDRSDVDTASIETAMNGLADLHASFSRHAMLPEPRFAAGDLGAYFYTRSVRDAFRCVDLLRPPALDLSPQEEAVRDGVLERLALLLDDERDRVRMLEQHAGPETLLHGDLTRENVFVVPGPGRQRVRLIDWDHVGVGPAGFDISTHVAYYVAPQRRLVLDLYTTAMAERGLAFPDDVDWDLLVSTFEAGRLANQIIWMAIGIGEGNGWGFDELADWGDALAAAVGGAGQAGLDVEAP